MIKRINRVDMELMAMDFETHADEESIEKLETGVWLSCIVGEDSTLEDDVFDYSMSDVMHRLEKISRDRQHKLIYIYNLAFEWSFIFPELMKRGFLFNNDIKVEDEYCYSSISTKSCSSVWSATIKFSSEHGIIEFRDLSKLYSGSLRSVAQSFNLPTQKGDIDYGINRRHDYVVTDEEKEYCFKDVKIIMDILKIMDERGDKEFFKSYSSSSWSCRKMLRTGFPKSKVPLNSYRKRYPILGDKEDNFVRKAVSGGITYATAKYQFVDIKQPIGHIDAHQMHPSSAFKNNFPRGFGTYGIGQPEFDNKHINCCRIRVTYWGARLFCNIELINKYLVKDYEMTVWDFEIPMMKRCYIGLEIEYLDYYRYEATYLPWRNYYKNNYDKRLESIAKGDLYGKSYYKLLNNSSYGKLLEKPHNNIIVNYLTESGLIDSYEKEKPQDEWENGSTYTYVPVGGCIPAYSRLSLLEVAYRIGWEKVVYFDTDSIFYIKDEETERIINQCVDMNNHLGGWGREPDIIRAQFTAPKRYKLIEEDEDNPGEQKLTIHSAGLQFDTSNPKDFDSINLVNGEYEVLSRVRVKGGTLLIPKTKILKIQEKYKQIYNSNIQVV